MINRFRQSYPSTRHEPVYQHTAGLKSGLLHSFGYGKPFMSDGFNCQNSRRPLFRWLTIQVLSLFSISGYRVEHNLVLRFLAGIADKTSFCLRQ